MLIYNQVSFSGYLRQTESLTKIQNLCIMPVIKKRRNLLLLLHLYISTVFAWMEGFTNITYEA